MEPLNLNATYKTPTRISLEWTFAMSPSTDYSYVVYYESGGGSHSVPITSVRDNRYDLRGIPVGGVTSVSLVALAHLPSPVAGPVTPGRYTVNSSCN